MWWRWMLLLLGNFIKISHQTNIYSLNSTFNLVKHLKSITASNTCGEEGSELYCLLTGTPLAPGLDYTYSRYPGEYIDGQFCNTCEPDQHDISNAVDENENNWWQSSSLATISDFDQSMTIDLDLGQEYQAVYFVLKAANSPRPARWVLEKSTDGGQTYTPWQIYVATDSDCELYYNMSASHFPVNFVSDDQVLCTSYYSTLNPLENGQIYTSLVIGRPGAELFYLNESPRLQEWMKATHVRLRLEKMQILHNLINDNDDTANRRFFCSLREIIVAGRCSCNGHASYCKKHNDASVRCNCNGNTCGANCETCCPGYNTFPWQPSSSGQFFQCEECQCYGHSDDCQYEASAEGSSVDIDGNVRGGAVCTACQNETEGLNCERCRAGYYRGERESLYDKTCRECDCNTANIQLVSGLEFGSCDQETGGQCYCKEAFGGRRCDECRADHFNAVDVGLHCAACRCDINGTVSQLHNCADMTGACFCKENVIGDRCRECRPETFNITLDNDYGCSDCGCNLGGSENNNCDKSSGQCTCKAGLDGRQCSEVSYKHYIPGPDFLSMEAEDGIMQGRDALYDFNEGVFKNGFHGRGYATLNSNVPSVEMEVEIPEFTRYKVDMSYQLEDSFQKYTGYITATNKETGEQEEYEATLDTCIDGCDVTVQRCVEDHCENVQLLLAPGTWTITFSYDAPSFNLDRVVLVPRSFEDPFIAETDVGSCILSNDILCNEYQLPNLEPYIHKTTDLTNETTVFTVDDGGDHSIIIDFLYNGTDIENLTLTITDGTAAKTGHFTIHYCDELQLCRAIVRDEFGQPLVYKSVPGELNVTFNEDIAHPIEGEMYLVVNTDDIIYALKPQYICMRGVNGRCSLNTFPIAFPKTVRPGNKGYILNKENNEKLLITDDYIVSRSNYDVLTEICGSTEASYEVRLNLVSYPNTYLILVEYFYTGLEDLTVAMSFSDNKVIVGQGVVTFFPCNGYSACRTVVVNMQSSSELFTTPSFSFEPRFVIASFVDFPVGKCILLNEITTTTAEGSSPSAMITPIPLRRTDEFLATCTPADTSQFCKTGYLTIAAEFFGGLPACGCNMLGSLSDVCEVYGGQCDCRDNIIGRTCDRCRAGYYGFPDCQPCTVARCSVVGSGFSSVCDEYSGECECAPNVIGERCELCDADSYNYHDVLGCKDCNCNNNGSSSSSCNTAGECFCKDDSITGGKCNECVEGRTGFPECELCGCDEAGSRGQICDTATGQCPCKEHTSSLLCNECEYGYYNLHDNNTAGCQECYCFGVTADCASAAMAYYKIGHEFENSDSQGWVVIDSANATMPNALKPLISESSEHPGLYELVVDSVNIRLLLQSETFDWLAPYKGDLTYSYGGELQFTLGYFPTLREQAARQPRIDIQGVNDAIYRELRLPQLDTYTPYSVPLDTLGPWYTSGGGVATKAQIMNTLVDVTSISLRGDLTDGMANYRLMSVSLDSAYPSSNGLALITQLEECSCPQGYTGYSCQQCTSGYYRVSSSSLTLGECVACDCNGHSNMCDINTGVCTGCAENTYGDHCEHCLAGYYGDAHGGHECQICPCPLPLVGNAFGNCSYDPIIGDSLTCSCEVGYEGTNCEECSPGYYGNPKIPGDKCSQCSTCNNNTDITADYCDRTTGDCVLCLNNTAGDECERCVDGYYGDAIFAKDCAECQCYEGGTVQGSTCDSLTGECSCEPNVVGQTCDTCQAGYWNLTNDVGCESCECNTNGTSYADCDQDTGQCICHDEVEGYRCDSCKDGFYGLTTLGHCTACDCNDFGSNSTECDKTTGQCDCDDGVTGQQCDICDEWAIVTDTGCDRCSGCNKILKDYMDELSGDIYSAIRLKETGGRINEDIEQLIEMKNTAILTKKEGLDTIEDLERQEGVWGTQYPLKSGSIRYQYNKLAAYHDANVIDKVEETEDALRSKQDDITSIVEQTGAYNSTYNQINVLLQESTDMVSNIQITAAEPAVIKSAIAKSKNKLKKIRAREKDIYTIEQSFVDELATLNSSIYASFGSLVETNLSDISEQTSTLSEGMKAVLSNAVLYVLTPTDEFMGTSDGVTGDLSNLNKTFNTRKKTLDDKILALETPLADQINLQSYITAQLTDTDQLLGSYFNDTRTNLTRDLTEDITANRQFLLRASIVDLNETLLLVEQRCVPLSTVVLAPDNPAQTIGNLHSFNNDTDLLGYTVAGMEDVADEIRTSVNQWSTNDLQVKQEELNVVKSAYVSLTYQIPSLDAKVTSDDLELVISTSDQLNVDLRGRLSNVTAQTQHQTRTKRYVSELSMEEFASTAAEMKKGLKKLDKSNKKTQKIGDLISDTEDKLANLSDLATENTQNIEQISSVLLGDDSEESLDTKIDQLKSKQSLSLAEKMKELESKMALIKEKMKRTREVASTVQVGVKMTDYSYLKLPMPLVAEQSSRYTGISLIMKTEETAGTLLYLGSSTSTNVFHLRLVEGSIQLHFDIGEGSTTVDTDVNVNDNEWHTIRVSRNGKFGYISIDSGNGRVSSFSGANGGSLDLLELDAQGYFFVGCSNLTANSSSPEDMFKGSLTQLRISNKLVGLWGYTESGGNLAPIQAQVKYSQFAAIPRDGLCMKGWGYAAYPGNGITLTADQPTTIDIRLQTFDRDGLIFRLRKLSVDTPDSLDISLTDGKLTFSSQSAVFTPNVSNSDVVISSGKVSTVSMELSGEVATVSVDGDSVSKYQLSSPLDWGSSDPKTIYVGGDNVTSVSGVIKNIIVDGIKLSLGQHNSLVYKGMTGSCLSSKLALDGISTFGSGYVRYPAVQFVENFRIDVRIRSSQPYGVILFASDALGFNAISLSIDDGQVEFVAMKRYVKTAVRTGQDVSDGNWHEVSIVRENSTITLNLDGYTSSTYLRDNVPYPTNHGLYVGGIPHTIPLLLDLVPHLLPFEGAIRSLAINGEMVDLSEFVEAEDVSLAGTTVRHSDKSYHTIQ